MLIHKIKARLHGFKDICAVKKMVGIRILFCTDCNSNRLRIGIKNGVRFRYCVNCYRSLHDTEEHKQQIIEAFK